MPDGPENEFKDPYGPYVLRWHQLVEVALFAAAVLIGIIGRMSMPALSISMALLGVACGWMFGVIAGRNMVRDLVRRAGYWTPAPIALPPPRTTTWWSRLVDYTERPLTYAAALLAVLGFAGWVLSRIW